MSAEEKNARAQLEETEAQVEALEEKIESLEKKGDPSGGMLDIDLREAAAGGALSTTVLIELTGEDIVLNGKAIESNALGSKLQQAVEENPDVRLFIDPDPNLPHARVAMILDQAKLAGIKRINLGVGQEPQPEPPPEPEPEPEPPPPPKPARAD